MIENLLETFNKTKENFGDLFLPLAAILSIIIIGFIIKFINKRASNIPVVPNGLPFFGHMFTMLKGSPWDTMAQWSLSFGKVYRVRLFGSYMTVIADPIILKIVLSTKLSVFKKDLAWTYKPFLTILGNGLVTSDGSSHRQQRILLAHHFRNDILDDIPNMALKAYQRLTNKLDKIKAAGSTVEMAEEFRHLTLQVIAEAILSIPPEESDQTFAHMYLPIVEEGNKRTWSPERAFLPNESWLVYGKAVNKLNDYVTNIIKRRKALRTQEKSNHVTNNNSTRTASNAPSTTTRKQDVLDLRIESIPDDEWNSSTIQQLCDEVKTFILAGHETSASMLTWSLLELSKNPALAARIREEGRRVFKGHLSPDGKRLISLPSMEEINTLHFADACLRESLRLYSVVPTVARVNAEDITVGDYYLPRGSTLLVLIQGVHHNPQYWPEPMKYDPDRFLGKQEIQPYTFLPFVEGPRMCIGQYLSLLETKIVLTALMLNYTFTIDNIDTASLKHAYMVPIIPKVGHFMKVN